MNKIVVNAVKEIADRTYCILRCMVSIFVYAIGGRKAVRKLAISNNKLALILNGKWKAQAFPFVFIAYETSPIMK